MASAVEIAVHLTGRYDDLSFEWPGRKWDKPVTGWLAGVSNETVRDSMQILLLGPPGQHGTGMVPKEALIDTSSARGISDLVDTIRVKHISGGISSLTLKTYASGREKFQGATLDFVALDEQPPWDVYSECLTRIGTTGGMMWSCFTPLLGLNEVARRFWLEKDPNRATIKITIDDITFLSEETKKVIADSYQEYEKAARLRGEPSLGSGIVFPLTKEQMVCEYRQYKKHWAKLIGIDFGWTHPFAAVEIWYDKERDIVYCAKEYRVAQQTPIYHAAVLRKWGATKTRVSWPRDGRRATLEGAGIPLKEQYQAEGLNMNFEHSQFLEGEVSVEAGLMEMLDRFKTGRLKIFDDLPMILEELSMYHRDENGKVVTEFDDLICALRYAIMDLRYAQSEAGYNSFNREIEYPKGYSQIW